MTEGEEEENGKSETTTLLHMATLDRADRSRSSRSRSAGNSDGLSPSDSRSGESHHRVLCAGQSRGC